MQKINPTNLESWNGLVGCRDGVDACITLAKYWNRKAPWEEAHDWLDTMVFKLSENVTSSDHTVI
jgi:hypothetical protein